MSWVTPAGGGGAHLRDAIVGVPAMARRRPATPLAGTVALIVWRAGTAPAARRRGRTLIAGIRMVWETRCTSDSCR
jgi:hypothetical protein